jgi:hypothetical protein
VDSLGVTDAQIYRSYYRAWAFFLANTLPPMPENGFPYPQVCAGKPSLWTGGAPHSEETSTWDGADAMQALALVDPATAWAAAQGIMSQVGPSGYLGGEALCPAFAQTFWLLYQQTGALLRLRSIYPSLKRYLAWKIDNPRWIFPNKSIADAKPSPQKDNEFVAHAIVDMEYAERITRALGMADELAFWQKQQRDLAANYQRWFWPAPGNVAYRLYMSDTDRGDPGDTWNLKGLQIPPDLLKPQSRDALLALYRKSINLQLPFLIPPNRNRFGDLEPIALGLFQYGQLDEFRQLTDAILRDVTRAGEFSEYYLTDGPPAAAGVRPSAFGARLMTDSLFWHNGVILDEGLPVLVGVPGAVGVANIPVDGSSITVRYGTPGQGAAAIPVTLRGWGLVRLQMPEHFRAVATPGSPPRWDGAIPSGAQIRLEQARQ